MARIRIAPFHFVRYSLHPTVIPSEGAQAPQPRNLWLRSSQLLWSSADALEEGTGGTRKLVPDLAENVSPARFPGARSLDYGACAPSLGMTV
jgi:hypothetical protein